MRWSLKWHRYRIFLCAALAVLPLVRTAAYKTSPSSLRFTKRAYNATIPESSVPKTYVRVDEKMGIFCGDPALEIRYKITRGNRDSFFSANEELTGDFWFLLVRTRTGQFDVLNRERESHYTLTVKAFISERHKKGVLAETETTVFVTVLDKNDVSPIFLQNEYEATVTEDTPLHTSILNVLAEDADLGINGEVYYSFKEPTEQFAIHPTTGVVSLTRPLRYTDKSVHDLTAVAKDRGLSISRTKPSMAAVRIRVKQVNLHGPEIYVQHLPDIIEQSNTDVYAIVRVVDRDAGVHGEIDRLEIIDGDPDGHFRIRPSIKHGNVKKNEYNVEVLKLLDRETAPRGYNLTLRARDRGVPPKETFKSVVVQLADINDNAPVFDREEYEANIPETAPVNSPVIKVKVTDADAGKNAEVLLEIVGGNEGKEFRINSNTGMLYTAVPLDVETKSYYTLTVSARDQGNIGSRRQTAAKIKVNVVDANDNDPLFDSPLAEVTVNENEPAGTIVTRVQAHDRDSGENSYISYGIANLNPVPFDIDHFAGIVRTTHVLDYESMRREYTLKIRASDWGLPYRRQTEMQLRVRLLDVNDNRPQFEKVDCIGHVPKTVAIGREVLTLSAIDFDAGNIISYRIVSGNEDNCFALDANIGTLSVTCDLNDTATSAREVNVTATDSKHFSDTMRIRINLVEAKKWTEGWAGDNGTFTCRDTSVAKRLTEILALSEKNNLPVALKEEFGMTPSRYGDNVHAPELINFPQEVRVNESVPLGHVLTTIRGRDRDLGYNGKLVYGISDGDDDSVFRLDPDTGDLRLISLLDRERRAHYRLNVTVYDLGKPQKSVWRPLTIVVLDANDNAPKFDRSLVNLRVSEATANGTAIHVLNATDADDGDNALVAYSLLYESRDFYVNATSGVLYIAAPLDRERQSFYELVVRAMDGASDLTSLHADAFVRVTVTDVNDNAPNFSLPQYSVRAREDIPVGAVVAILTATDPDLDEGGRVTYSMTAAADETASLFSIDHLTGTVRLAQSLDFEKDQVHTLTVRATDNGVPPLYSQTKLVLEVIDVNENVYAPVFDAMAVSCAVLENQPPHTFVKQVRATDADAVGDDSKVGYTLREGDGLGYFSIDSEGKCRPFFVVYRRLKRLYSGRGDNRRPTSNYGLSVSNANPVANTRNIPFGMEINF